MDKIDKNAQPKNFLPFMPTSWNHLTQKIACLMDTLIIRIYNKILLYNRERLSCIQLVYSLAQNSSSILLSFFNEIKLRCFFRAHASYVNTR